MLDCYRVTILQRPPSCDPDLTRTFFGKRDDPNPVRQLFTPNSPVPINASQDTCTWLLAVASYFTPSGNYSSRFSWRPEFAESALAAWANSKTRQSTSSMELIYHLMNIELHANLSSLQALARARLSATRGESAAYKSSSRKVCQWLATVNYKISEWHAQQIVEVASATNLDDATSSQTKSPEERRIAMPHTPYCIYFATLVLWCGAIKTDSSILTSWYHIHRGISLLSNLGIRVASVLAEALEEIGYPDVEASPP